MRKPCSDSVPRHVRVALDPVSPLLLWPDRWRLAGLARRPRAPRGSPGSAPALRSPATGSAPPSKTTPTSVASRRLRRRLRHRFPRLGHGPGRGSVPTATHVRRPGLPRRRPPAALGPRTATLFRATPSLRARPPDRHRPSDHHQCRPIAGPTENHAWLFVRRTSRSSIAEASYCEPEGRRHLRRRASEPRPGDRDHRPGSTPGADDLLGLTLQVVPPSVRPCPVRLVRRRPGSCPINPYSSERSTDPIVRTASR